MYVDWQNPMNQGYQLPGAIMEDPRRRSSSKAARRLHRLLTLAGKYIKYLFMNRRRLLGRVTRRTLAVLSYHGNSSKHLAPYYLPPPALMEHEFSFSDSPRPAFLAAKRLQSRLKRSAVAGSAVSSCFGNLRASHGGSPLPPRPATERMEDEVVEEEEKEEADGWMLGEVELDLDYRADEFINMFYEQLWAQSFPAVSQCSP